MHNLIGRLAAIVLGLIALMSPQIANAWDCNALVVDDAGVLSGSQESTVAASAKSLQQNKGALVRVRLVNDHAGHGSIDDYVYAHRDACRSWQTSSGKTQANLLIFAISYGNQKGATIKYGDLWKRALETEWHSILTEDMVPYLRGEDNVGALTNSMRAVSDTISAQKASRTARTTGAPVVVREPTDLSGLWGVMRWMLLILVGGGGVWGFVSWRRKQERIREAQQRAILARDACVTHVVDAEQPIVLAEARLNTASAHFAATDIDPLRQKMAAIRRSYNRAQTHYGELQASDANPDQPKLTEAMYAQIEQRYTALLAQLREATSGTVEITQSLERLQELSDQAAELIAQTGDQLERDGARIIEIDQAKYFVQEPNALLEQALEAFAAAEAARENKAFGQMQTSLNTAQRLSTEAAQLAESYPAIRSQIASGINSSRTTKERAVELLRQARTAFSAISAEFAQACWESVRGNGSRAQRLIQDADRLLTQADAKIQMDTQDWNAGTQALARATQTLEQAHSLCQAIISLKTQLERAKSVAADEVRAAERDLAEVIAYERRHDADIHDRIKPQIAQAQQTLQQAMDELRESKPNYIQVVKWAKAVSRAADELLRQARNEVAQMERLRRAVATQLREAERSIDQAERYIRSNSYDVGSSAESRLRDARSALSSAQSSRSLRDRLSYAERADEYADRAYSMARSDVSAAEAERAAEAAAVAAAAEAAQRAAYSSSFNDDDDDRFGGGFGGGSVDWGGGGNLGGGSVDWDGGDDLGGGSVDW